MEFSLCQHNSTNNNRTTSSKKEHRCEQNSKIVSFMNQQGKLQIQKVNIPRMHSLYISDSFTTLVELHWRYVILLFISSFLTSWLLFGSLWWAVYTYRLKHFNVTCIEQINGWTSAFLFSLESQTTIGYGGRQITPDCPEATILLLVQCIVGLIIQSTMGGLVFTKLQQPYLSAATILFSNAAVIAPRNGKLCLMFRIGNVRKSQLLRPNILVLLVEKGQRKVSRRTLRVTIDVKDTTQTKELYLFLPVIVYHVIDEKSPLYQYTEGQIDKQFEIYVILQGITEATGNVVQARTKYLSDQIRWNHVFCKMAHEGRKSINGQYIFDFSKFHCTEQVTSRQDEVKHDCD